VTRRMTRVEDIIFRQHDSDFLVRGFFSFSSARHVVFALEYMPGGDLGTMLADMGCLPEASVRFYFAEVLLGLEYLHLEGVVHHDIKPQNMLVSATGHLKLTDFGLSTTLRSGSKWRGTLPYVAPEILEGEHASFAVDMWAYGIVLFEALTGDYPVPCESPDATRADRLATIQQHTDHTGTWRPPTTAARLGVSEAALALCTSLLVIEPSARSDCRSMRRHAFFEGTRWAQRELETPPFVPVLSGDEDVSYFEHTSGFQPFHVNPALSDEGSSDEDAAEGDSFKGGVHCDHLVRLSLSEVSGSSTSSLLER